MGIKKKSILIIGGAGSAGVLLSSCMRKSVKEELGTGITIMTAEEALEKGLTLEEINNTFKVSNIPVFEQNKIHIDNKPKSPIDAIIKNNKGKGKKRRW